MTAPVWADVQPEIDRHLPGPRARRWWLVGLVLLISYNTWVWIVPVNGHPAIVNGYLSELSASDQPHDLFFRFGDGLSAVLVAVIGVVGWRRWPALATCQGAGRRSVRWWRAAACFLLLFALTTGLDAVTAMDCSPTLSTACRTAEADGQLSWAHYLHTPTSIAAQTGIVGSMVAAALAERPRRVVARRGLLWVLVAVEVLGLAVMMIMLAAGLPGIGYPQAVMVTVASVWFAVAAVAARPRSARGSRP